MITINPNVSTLNVKLSATISASRLYYHVKKCDKLNKEEKNSILCRIKINNW